ncbi:MAG: hypothetical protein QOE04_4045 [Mycobacterium sp.]|nr:hypothetical protein [Mycobacterium sp.]
MAKSRSLTSDCMLNTDDGVINAAVAAAVVLGRLQLAGYAGASRPWRSSSAPAGLRNERLRSGVDHRR